VQNGYKEEFGLEELVEFRDASLPGYKDGSRGIEFSEYPELGCGRIIEKKWQERNSALQRRLHSVLQ
jgi:hypothetical protein